MVNVSGKCNGVHALWSERMSRTERRLSIQCIARIENGRRWQALNDLIKWFANTNYIAEEHTEIIMVWHLLQASSLYPPFSFARISRCPVSSLSICAPFISVWWQMSNAHSFADTHTNTHTHLKSRKNDLPPAHQKWRKSFCVRNVRCWQWQQGKMGRDNKSVSDTWLIFGVTLIDCRSLWPTAYGPTDIVCMRQAKGAHIDSIGMKGRKKKWLKVDHFFLLLWVLSLDSWCGMWVAQSWFCELKLCEILSKLI